MPDHLKKKGQQTWEDRKPRQRIKTKLESRKEARRMTADALMLIKEQEENGPDEDTSETETEFQSGFNCCTD
jgi:hypothetical protein